MANRNLSILRVLLRLRQAEIRLRPWWWRLLHPGITIGPGVRIGRGCRLFLDAQAQLVLGRGAEIDDATTIAIYGAGRIVLGDDSFVGHHCTLAARESIVIGARTLLAELVSVRDHDHVVGLSPSSPQNAITPVQIGDDVWIGAKCTVIRGTRIGDRTVIGANAVARGELPADALCVGVPARVVRSLVADRNRRADSRD